ncbi:MAG: sulfatase [Planctomycetes bacterium]|nr:sulfatase [Planctomycetota bacterium]
MKNISIVARLLGVFLLFLTSGCSKTQTAPPANIVFILADDLGAMDVGAFNPDTFYETPNLDALAASGMRFTNAYAASPVCSPTRASIMTGKNPGRLHTTDWFGAPQPDTESEHWLKKPLLPARYLESLPHEEVTVAEALREAGYRTFFAGKWHLGHHPKFLPTRHGFDEYFGLPYSNDMWPFHPTAGDRFPDLPMFAGEKIINPKVTPEDQTHLTTWYTEHAVTFIEQNKDRPFLLYVPHSMPHVPLFVSEKFKGKSKQGLYGDVIMEIDWSVGEILKTLKRFDLDENTLVIYTSDNGPWLSYGDHGGSALPLREGKGTAWEGGQREPTVMRWPAKIPAGRVCHELAATIDILPTVAKLIGAKLPKHKIDGEDISALLFGTPGAKSPHEAYYFYWGRHLHAVRSGKWKLHFPHSYRSLDGKPGGTGGKPSRYVQLKTGLALYNLDKDISESTNVAEQHPKVVTRLKALAEKAREDLGDSATKQQGNGVRPPGRL